MIWHMIYHHYFTMRIDDFTMIRLELFKNKTTVFYKSLFFSTKKWKLCNGVVSKWKSKVSAFQNIKNHWNPFSIREDMLNFVLESIIIVCARVYPLWWGLMTVMRPHHRGYTRAHTIIIDSNTKFNISSRILNRFQWFLMFWKAETLLFHLETTPLRGSHFLVEKNKDLQKSVHFLLRYSSLIIVIFQHFINKYTKYVICHDIFQKTTQ